MRAFYHSSHFSYVSHQEIKGTHGLIRVGIPLRPHLASTCTNESLGKSYTWLPEDHALKEVVRSQLSG
jgi:hypothetical protein